MSKNNNTDDRNLAEYGSTDPHYWYSVSDGFRLVLWLRQNYLHHSIFPANLGEENVCFRENDERILITDPYYSGNFAHYLTDDINRITATNNFTGSSCWTQMPTTIIIPLLSGLHWRTIKININYDSKQVSILFDDPYGQGTFPEDLKLYVLDPIKESVEKLIRIQSQNESFNLTEDLIKKEEKAIDQQGHGENSWDCGPITFSNIEDYVKATVNKDPIVQYNVPVYNSLEHDDNVKAIRTNHVFQYSKVSGIEIEQSRLEAIERAFAEEQNFRKQELEKLHAEIAGRLSGFEIIMLVEILANKRLFEGNNSTKEYSKQELAYAYQVVLNERKSGDGNLSLSSSSDDLDSAVSSSDDTYKIGSKSYKEKKLITLQPKPAIDKKAYNHLLDALDIIRIKNVINEVEEIIDLEDGDKDGISRKFSFFKFISTVKGSGEHNDQESRNSYCIDKYSSISKNISLLSTREGSIRNYFTNFPWDALEKISDFLQGLSNEGDRVKYTSLLGHDLSELKTRLEYILKVTELKHPELKNLLDPTLVCSDRDNFLTTIYKDFKFVDEHDTKPRGLANIRKITEPLLDKEQQDKILTLISKAKDCDPAHEQGRSSLFSIAIMVGETTKNISHQTKLLNPDIPFKELKEFRNKLHSLDTVAQAKNLLEFVENEDNFKVFGVIKAFLTEELENKIQNLVLPTVDNSTPVNLENPLPQINCLPNQATDDIVNILEVVKQALPGSARPSTLVQEKLSICEDILLGKLPIPLGIAPQALLVQIFYDELTKEEFSKYKDNNFDAALRQNHDALKTDDRRKINEDIKFVNSLRTGEAYGEDIVSQALSIIKQALPPRLRETEQVQIKLNICREVLVGNEKLPASHNKIQGYFVSIFNDELAHYKHQNFTTALNKNHDALKVGNRAKVQEDCKSLDGLNKQGAYKAIPHGPSNDPSAKVTCFEPFLKVTEKPKQQQQESRSKEEQRKVDLYYIDKQLEMLQCSLEKINQYTNAVISIEQDYHSVREVCDAPQFHYSHLFRLLVIGQAIQNLVGKELFLQSATPKLLIEFEFLKWVRNGLMHDASITEIGSAFSYFSNDLLDLHIREHGSRAYDTDAYLTHLKPEIGTSLHNIKIQANPTDLSNIYDFYYGLILKQLEIALDNSGYGEVRFILNRLGYKDSDYDILDTETISLPQILLSKSTSLPLEEFYDKQVESRQIADKYGISIVGFFGGIVEWGSAYKKNSGIYIKGEFSNNDLAMFKQEMQQLLCYRFMIITDEHLKESLAPNGNKNKEEREEGEYEEFLGLVHGKHSLEQVMNAMAIHLAIINKAGSDEIEKLELDNCCLDLVYQGYTPLYRAYVENNEQILSLLLEAGADANTYDFDGSEETLLHQAVDDLLSEEDRDKALNFILKARGLELIAEDRWKVNPLHALAYYGEYIDDNYLQKAASKLIEGASESELNQIDGYGKTALLEALEKGNIVVALQLASNPKVNVNLVREQSECEHYIPVGCSPLMAATLFGYNEVVMALVSHSHLKITCDDHLGFEYVKVTDGKGCIKHNYPYERGNSKHYKFNSQSSALHIVTAIGNQELLELLLGALGPDALLKYDSIGNTILHTACRYQREEIIKLLLDKDKLDSLFSEHFGNVSEQLYSEFVNFKDHMSNTAIASHHLPDNKFLKFSKIFLSCEFFNPNTREGSYGKSVLDMIIEHSDTNLEFKQLASSKKVMSNTNLVPPKVLAKLDGAFEDSWFGETVILRNVGVDDLVNLYITKETIKTTGTFRKTIVTFDIEIENLSVEDRKEELLKTVNYTLEGYYNVTDIYYVALPQGIDLELLRAINKALYASEEGNDTNSSSNNDDIFEFQICSPITASIKATKVSTREQTVTENFEITYDDLLSRLGMEKGLDHSNEKQVKGGKMSKVISSEDKSEKTMDNASAFLTGNSPLENTASIIELGGTMEQAARDITGVANQENITSLQFCLDEYLSEKLVIIPNTNLSLRKIESNKIQWYKISNAPNTQRENELLEQLASLAIELGVEIIEDDTASLTGYVGQLASDLA